MTMTLEARPAPTEDRLGPSVSASHLFDQKRTSRVAIGTILTLFVVLAAAVGWASKMPLAEIATSSGEVVPSQAVLNVQHFEGGIVEEVRVEEGQQVQKGETLIVLAPEMAETELAQLQTRKAGLGLRVELLSATLQDRLAAARDEIGTDKRIVDAELAALQARRDNFERQVAVLRQQVVEREAERATLVSQTQALQQQIDLLDEILVAQRRLLESGYVARLRLIEDERELARLTGERATMETEALRLKERIREGQSRIAELQATFRSELASEIRTLTAELADLDLAIERARDRVTRLQIVAPTSGRIQDLQVQGTGGVVEAGATLMEIVPRPSQPRIEARISPEDIGHIRAGQAVEVKVQTYDYSRYGKLDGRIQQLSATTFLDSNGAPYYKARIELDRAYLGTDDALPLTPGMTIIADIITGERTLLAYLSTPILKSLDSGLRER